MPADRPRHSKAAIDGVGASGSGVPQPGESGPVKKIELDAPITQNGAAGTTVNVSVTAYVQGTQTTVSGVSIDSDASKTSTGITIVNDHTATDANGNAVIKVQLAAGLKSGTTYYVVLEPNNQAGDEITVMIKVP